MQKTITIDTARVKRLRTSYAYNALSIRARDLYDIMIEEAQESRAMLPVERVKEIFRTNAWNNECQWRIDTADECKERARLRPRRPEYEENVCTHHVHHEVYRDGFEGATHRSRALGNLSAPTCTNLDSYLQYILDICWVNDPIIAKLLCERHHERIHEKGEQEMERLRHGMDPEKKNLKCPASHMQLRRKLNSSAVPLPVHTYGTRRAAHMKSMTQGRMK